MLIICFGVVVIGISVYDLLHIGGLTPSALDIGLDPVEDLVAAPLTSLLVHQAFHLRRVVLSKVRRGVVGLFRGNPLETAGD